MGEKWLLRFIAWKYTMIIILIFPPFSDLPEASTGPAMAPSTDRIDFPQVQAAGGKLLQTACTGPWSDHRWTENSYWLRLKSHYSLWRGWQWGSGRPCHGARCHKGPNPGHFHLNLKKTKEGTHWQKMAWCLVFFSVIQNDLKYIFSLNKSCECNTETNTGNVHTHTPPQTNRCAQTTEMFKQCFHLVLSQCYFSEHNVRSVRFMWTWHQFTIVLIAVQPLPPRCTKRKPCGWHWSYTCAHTLKSQVQNSTCNLTVCAYICEHV